MNIMKKLFVLSFIVLSSFLLASPSLASEKPSQLEDLSQLGDIVYQDNEITVRDLGNDPLVSNIIAEDPNSVIADEDAGIKPKAVGPGGRAVINAADNGRTIYWTVRPKTLWPFHFEGYVKLRYYSGFKRDAPIGGMGALGSSISGAVHMNKNNGGYATLKGTAYSLDMSKYSVLPGVGTSF
ncbi:hypothetical protein KY305_11335 [Bacillus sp. YC2]|uniref:hypothetical protein n=1 Tax=Bacillus sp. YC2 TaxID=2861287 RepID=UPI001CA6AB1A|nr:hypothetical protein [Bacillus sp. YC2]MBY8913333.1 hypothetical protein [Bacillus sp. YC2]